MKYNCDECGIEMEIDGDKKTDYGGIECTIKQYIEQSQTNDSVVICCKSCLDKMTDVGHLFDAGLVRAVPKPEKNN